MRLACKSCGCAHTARELEKTANAGEERGGNVTHIRKSRSDNARKGGKKHNVGRDGQHIHGGVGDGIRQHGDTAGVKPRWEMRMLARSAVTVFPAQKETQDKSHEKGGTQYHQIEDQPPSSILKQRYPDGRDQKRRRGMIGKGARLPEVVDAMKKYSGVYFGAIGGAGALLAKCIKKREMIAYEDLGAEALQRLYVENMPLVVIIDSEGNNLYETGRAAYLEKNK